MEIAQLNNLVASTGKTQADADKANADAVLKAVEGQAKKYALEHQVMADGVHAGALDA
jgi:competence protein ComGC